VGSRLLVLSGGNVGVGAGAPAAKLHVGGGSGSGLTSFEVNGEDLDAGLIARFRRPSSAEPALTIGTFGGNQAWIASEKDLGFHTRQSGQAAGATRMRILPNGHVGVGTDSPTKQLSVGAIAEAPINQKSRVRI